jgi:hypothetical protein
MQNLLMLIFWKVWHKVGCSCHANGLRDIWVKIEHVWHCGRSRKRGLVRFVWSIHFLKANSGIGRKKSERSWLWHLRYPFLTVERLRLFSGTPIVNLELTITSLVPTQYCKAQRVQLSFSCDSICNAGRCHSPTAIHDASNINACLCNNILDIFWSATLQPGHMVVLNSSIYN